MVLPRHEGDSEKKGNKLNENISECGFKFDSRVKKQKRLLGGNSDEITVL